MSIRFDGLGIHFGYVPKSIQLPGFELPVLGVLVSLGLILGILFVVQEAKRRNQDQDAFLGAVLMTGLGAVIGGRLFYAGFFWSLFSGDPASILNLRTGGMAYFGALIGGMLFLGIYSSLRKLPFAELADTLTFGVLLVQMFARLGDFFNRESFGLYTEWAGAMQLPLSSVRAGEVTSEMREKLLTIDGAPWISVHPTFLYDMVLCLVIFLILCMIKGKKKYPGQIYMTYLVLYCLGRIGVEWLRTDQMWIPETTLPVNIILAAVIAVIFVPTMIVSRSMAKKRTVAAERRRKELEEAKAVGAAEAEAEASEPVDIEAILREEEALREQERLEAER
ncbi:MAG: prolipoprotein diacylglyceryl transferase, partial [Clostridiales bacterium]|nr:prolipoprotein diacylglyceryl transferase [Candidatus Blautia equi]